MIRIFLILFLVQYPAWCQNSLQPILVQKQSNNELSFNEFLGYVKKYHPLVKNANLEISRAQANLMKARGGFDPKIDVDFKEKKFKNKEYYSILNSSFKIPTWYGIEIKAGFDNSEGIYINPENTTPNSGLTSLGINIPLGQGLFINQRMADLKKAKIQVALSDAQRKLEAIQVLYDASVAYFNWKRIHNEVQLYEQYNSNALKRFNGIRTLIIQGDKASIDSIEAGINLKKRQLSLENSKLKLSKAKLDLANFLWFENNIPMELTENMIPEENLEASIQETLKMNQLFEQSLSIDNHPKVAAMENKIKILNVEKKHKANMLLPKVDIGYSFLSEPSYIDNYRFEDYKIGLNFNFPLFLRKERGSLKLANYKIQEAEFSLSLEKKQLQNKIAAQKLELESLLKQKEIINNLVTDYEIMLKSEERLFSFGESSLFLINTRENNLVSAQLEALTIENNYYISNSELFKILANPD